MKACVLITCQPGKSRDAAAEIRRMKNVKRCFPVLGQWDVVAEVNERTTDGLGRLVAAINGMPSVKSTETLIQI